MTDIDSKYNASDFDVTPNSPDEPMTGDQADLLQVLCAEASEPFNDGLTQIEAHRRIIALRNHLNTDQNL